MSKKVKIMRKEYVRYGIPLNVAAEKVENIGSYFVGRKTARPLTMEEEDKWMETIVGLTPKDPTFRKSVEAFYQNLVIIVDSGGMELEIDLDKNGNPIDLEDFIKWRMAVKHPKRGEDANECRDLQNKSFWIEDPEKEKSKKTQTLGLNKNAYVELSKLAENETKIDWVIRSCTHKYSESMGPIRELLKLTSEEKELKLEDIIKKDATYFLEIVNDIDLSFKAEIASLVESQILKKEGTRYINGTDSLGDLNSTISWMKDPNNGEEYAILKARLEQFGLGAKKEKSQKKENK